MASKLCPQCKKTVGPRTLKCDCGFSFFTEDGKSTVAKPVSEKVNFDIRTAVIAVPAGKCPIDWFGDLEGWILAISQYSKAKEHRLPYAPSALKYFLRELVPGQDLKEHCRRIDEICGSAKSV